VVQIKWDRPCETCVVCDMGRVGCARHSHPRPQRVEVRIPLQYSCGHEPRRVGGCSRHRRHLDRLFVTGTLCSKLPCINRIAQCFRKARPSRPPRAVGWPHRKGCVLNERINILLLRPWSWPRWPHVLLLLYALCTDINTVGEQGVKT
jgi:hypothetical protein